MRHGWIEFWSTKQYGFIYEENGPSYFLHITNCDGFVPTKGRLVTFEAGRSTRGPIAINVRPEIKTGLEKATSLGGAQ